MRNYKPYPSKILYLNKVYLCISYYIYDASIVGFSSCRDRLEIKGLETKTFCGTALPVPSTTKLNVVKLVLTSNGRIQQTGFDLTFTTLTSMLTYNHTLQLKKCRYINIIIQIDLFEKKNSVRT